MHAAIHICTHAYIHIYIHTYTQTYIDTHIHTDMHAPIDTSIHTFICTKIHPYKQTSSIHTYIHIPTYSHPLLLSYLQSRLHHPQWVGDQNGGCTRTSCSTHVRGQRHLASGWDLAVAVAIRGI